MMTITAPSPRRATFRGTQLHDQDRDEMTMVVARKESPAPARVSVVDTPMKQRRNVLRKHSWSLKAKIFLGVLAMMTVISVLANVWLFQDIISETSTTTTTTDAIQIEVQERAMTAPPIRDLPPPVANHYHQAGYARYYQRQEL